MADVAASDRAGPPRSGLDPKRSQVRPHREEVSALPATFVARPGAAPFGSRPCSEEAMPFAPGPGPRS